MNKTAVWLYLFQGICMGLFFVTLYYWFIEDIIWCQFLSIVFFNGTLGINRLLVITHDK